MGIAWLHESIRPICLNPVIVRMRAGEIGLAMKRTDDGVLLEGGSETFFTRATPWLREHTSDEEGGTEPAIGWTGQLRLNDDIMHGKEHANCQADGKSAARTGCMSCSLQQRPFVLKSDEYEKV